MSVFGFVRDKASGARSLPVCVGDSLLIDTDVARQALLSFKANELHTRRPPHPRSKISHVFNVTLVSPDPHT